MTIHGWAVLALLATLPRAAAGADDLSSRRDGPARPVVEHVDFERHVASLFGRLGCNAGACHGSFEGQGGFRLSLFSQSPSKDLAAIAGDADSRRVVPGAPEQSLLLAKPSGRVEHEGGLRLPKDSWEYDLIRRWIAGGLRHTAGSGIVRELIVEPRGAVTLAGGDSLSLKSLAIFADGSSENVTAFSEFRSSDESVAAVDASGRVTIRGPGCAPIVASYLGSFQSMQVIVPFGPNGEVPERLPAANFIDEIVDRRLDQLGLASSSPASDAEFLRRATLDVLGTVPTVEDVRAFLVDTNPGKRDRAIDRLLAHPRRAAVWACRMCDVTVCNVDTMESPESLRPKRAKMWHDWLRKRFAENVPYDEIARGVLCATSRDDEPIERWIEEEAYREQTAQDSFESDYAERPFLDLYWRRVGPNGAPPVEDLVELTASAFLGLRMHCARCHHHPYDRWSQRDFAGFAQVLSRVQFGSSTELRTEMNRQLESRRQKRESADSIQPLPRLQEVYLSPRSRALVDAAVESDAPPTLPGGVAIQGTADPRERLVDWLAQPENPYFASSFVNRVWAKYFGRGLVEPLDDMSASNPPGHPELLDELAREFVRSEFDVAHMERLILSSNAYQRAARPMGNNTADSRNFARAPVRALPAETLIDALNHALETHEEFGPDVPGGSTAHEVAPNRLSATNANVTFRVLGRGDRKSLCECDRATGPSIRQAIYLMSDANVLQKISAGRLSRLLQVEHDDDAILEELYLATLSRLPDDDEREFLRNELASSPGRREAFVDIVWAILNTREFSTNH